MLIVVLLLAVTTVFIVWRLTWAAPAWYRPHDASNTDAAVLAEAVENRLVEEAHKVRPDSSPWTLRVRSDHVNSWLSVRLPRWLIHEQDLTWPEQLGTPQVRLTGSGVELALMLSPDQSPRVFVVRVLPTIVDDRLFLTFDRFSLGRIAMVGYTLDDLIERATEYGAEELLAQPEVTWLLDVLAGRESLQPLATLADDRRVRLLDVQMGDDYVDLKMQTLPPG